MSMGRIVGFVVGALLTFTVASVLIARIPPLARLLQAAQGRGEV